MEGEKEKKQFLRVLGEKGKDEMTSSTIFNQRKKKE